MEVIQKIKDFKLKIKMKQISPTGPGCSRNPERADPESGINSFPVMGAFSIRERKELQQYIGNVIKKMLFY